LNVRIFGASNDQSSDVTVLTQSPAAGEKVTRGSVVSITLGNKNDSDGTFFEPDADIGE
jgi:beta-lactam-binding protein with PASTA domain